MEQTWRWYGPRDRITLKDIRQTGATGIVTALHHIPNGEEWTVEEIMERKKTIEDAGLRWSVVESVPVHEDIKKHTGNYQKYIENYKKTIANLAQCGIYTVCYNFMPVLDWTRTDLTYHFEDGSEALRYVHKHFVAFDVFILERPNARKDYPEELVEEAEIWYRSIGNGEINVLSETIIKGLPGSEESYTLDDLRNVIASYSTIDNEQLRANLFYFLDEVVPVAEKAELKLAVHADDPPWGLLGLPRIVSTYEDLQKLLSHYDSVSNGLTLCTGSFGAGYFNDVPRMAKSFANRINFLHLRNVSRDKDLNFYEDYLLQGDIDIFDVVKTMVEEEERRKQEGRNDILIPVRPDHGNQMFGDLGQKNNPGYSLYGRMKGLAEIRGLEAAVRRMQIPQQ
ncbi:MAG: mannonate dehydratase [Bacteroidales bacterium]|nr:mannonate dehydratase [Bacteroidales bacterium]